MLRYLALSLLLLVFPLSFAQLSCTSDVPQETCKMASSAFWGWDQFLMHKVPIVIADPTTFQQELKGLTFTVDSHGLARNPLAQTYSQLIMIERDKGNRCPVRVVVSSDLFLPLDLKTLKHVPGIDSFKINTAADYIGGFLAGCESSLDY